MAAFTISPHALTRAVDMNLTGDEIRDAFERPRRTEWIESSRSTAHTRGRITVFWRLDGRTQQPVITTVMWATANAWVADSQFAPLPGREDRTVHETRRVSNNRRKHR